MAPLETESAESLRSLSLLSHPCGMDSQLWPKPKFTRRSLLSIFQSTLKAEYFGAYWSFLADLGTHIGTLHTARSQRSSSQATTPTTRIIFSSPSHLNNMLLRSQERSQLHSSKFIQNIFFKLCEVMFVISLYEKAASKTTSMWPYCHTTYQDKHSLSVNAVKIYCCHQQHCYMDSL